MFLCTLGNALTRSANLSKNNNNNNKSNINVNDENSCRVSPVRAKHLSDIEGNIDV